jgi:hypothetical protein
MQQKSCRGLEGMGQDASMDFLQVAILRWHQANLAASFGSAPGNMAFDGAKIWVSNSVSDTVSKL